MHPSVAFRQPAAGRGAYRGGSVLAVAMAAAMLAGCTMCPDPFDYSGPVPNGNVGQNDFRARSNGILPLGGQPPTWPRIVERSRRPLVEDPLHVLGRMFRGESDPVTADDAVAADTIPVDAILPRGIRLASVEFVAGDDDDGDHYDAAQPISTVPGSGIQPSGTTASFGTTATPSRTR
jgi:hypothetical protein